ncbi:MAG: hydrogenase iron-sulfur subunit [Candidatus Sumerlaeia bacterium]|nr:hydrogenase iron-sulfur subunit [Candidatus Sumerlaeia bacterium]
MERDIRVYLCSGCGIGEAVNIEALAKTVQKDCKPASCVTHPCLCGEEGLAVIQKDLTGERPCTVVIGACSGRVNTDLFAFPPPNLVERANLREQMAWRRMADEDADDTRMLAEDILRMAVAKAKKTEIPEPYVAPAVHNTVLVVGGGLTGLTAALDCARAGAKVVLVEKEAALGGHVAALHRDTPQKPPYRDPEVPDIARKIEEVRNCPDIEVLLSAEIEKIAGQPGMFGVTIRQANGQKLEQASAETADTESEAAKKEFQIGAIVLATGARPYDATQLTHLGFGRCQNVITHADLETMAKAGKIVRPSDSQPARRVAFIQCAGSRDPERLPYCSTTCCMTSLKQATYIREQNPDAQVYVLYKDMRTPGQYENFYRRVQEDEGIFLTKGEVTGVEEEPDKSLLIQVRNALLGENIQIRADLVVLATGMVPSTLNAQILHLAYRQGGDLPVDKYGFPNSHFICFPYETRRTGIYAAGCVRQPMDSAAAVRDASGAALKALQCVAMTARGAAVHPRANDLSWPDFYLKRCTQCKRCTEECPFGALNEDVKGTPEPNPTRCRRCGICLGACPERIINFATYSIEMISAMIKAVEVPDETEEKPRVLVLVCENDAYPAFDIAGRHRLGYDPNIRIIPVRCLGSINVVWIKDALSRGFDGILMIGCKYGDDYQCHFIKGSELMNTRSENIQEALTSMVLESERVRMEQLALTEYHRIPELIGGFMETIKEVGFNPFKGM